MRTVMLCALVGIGLCLLGAAAGAGGGAADTGAARVPEVEVWSKPMGGLRGRLLLSMHENDKTNIWTYAEIEGITTDELVVSSHPQMEWHLTDGAGKEVRPNAGMRGGGSGGESEEQWIKVPVGGDRVSLRLRRMGGFGGDPGTTILALQAKTWGFGLGNGDGAIWALPPGEYGLSATLTCEKNAAGGGHQWVGKLELPAVRFRVVAP